MAWWRTRWARAAGLAAAVVLLGLAVALALREVSLEALVAAGKESPRLLAALVGLAAVNLLLTAGLFWAITRSFEAEPRVGLGVMVELIAVSALLNFVPVVRPGLWGRAAYLKAKHGLAVGHSLLTLMVVLALAVGASAAALVMLLPGAMLAWGVFGALVVLGTAASGPVGRAALRRPIVLGWLWVPLKAADLLVTGARLWLAFQVVGSPIAFEAAVLAAGASLLVKLAGVTPNGLGLSEWVVAALAGAVTPVGVGVGAAAALVDRGAEVAAVVGMGAWGAWRLRLRENRPRRLAPGKAPGKDSASGLG